jgi:hypothetical protein
MEADFPAWKNWAELLKKKGLDGPAAALIEAAGPLNLVLAQLVYFSQPFLGRMGPGGQWKALAQMLEDRESSHSFAAFLRKEGTQ